MVIGKGVISVLFKNIQDVTHFLIATGKDVTIAVDKNVCLHSLPVGHKK